MSKQYVSFSDSERKQIAVEFIRQTRQISNPTPAMVMQVKDYLMDNTEVVGKLAKSIGVSDDSDDSDDSKKSKSLSVDEQLDEMLSEEESQSSKKDSKSTKDNSSDNTSTDSEDSDGNS